MSYLILSDFKKLIQTDNLAAIVGSDYTLVTQAINAALTEVKSYLVQKYDFTKEFTDTVPWIRATAYKGNNRVYLDATTYSATATYAINDLALYAGNVYICITAILAPGEVFNGAHWTLIGSQYTIFYVTLPYPEFTYSGEYRVGDIVWWKDKTYTCKIATVVPSHESSIQYSSYSSIPLGNVAPDDTAAGFAYWGTGTAYSVTAATLPTDTTKWTAGDNRNQQLVNSCIDVTLYTLHSRISPRNIPDLRVKRYDDTIKWLKNAAKGTDVTADLPKIQPAKGSRVRWGSDVRRKNNY